MPRHLRHIQLMSGIALLHKSSTDISILKKQKMNIISMIMYLCRRHFIDADDVYISKTEQSAVMKLSSETFRMCFSDSDTGSVVNKTATLKTKTKTKTLKTGDVDTKC